MKLIIRLILLILLWTSFVRADPRQLMLNPIPQVVYLSLVGNHSCTGFVIEKNILITAHHCVEDNLLAGNPFIEAHYIDGSRTPLLIAAHGISEDLDDWAVLVGDTGSIPPLMVAEEMPAIGSKTRSVGFGGDLRGQAFSDGEFQGISWQQKYKIATQVIPGDSGSPLLDSKGRAVGIVIQTSCLEPLAFAIPIHPAIVALHKLQKTLTQEPFHQFHGSCPLR